MEEFPQLTKEDLYKISLGSYQIREARSYYGEHVEKNGGYSIQVIRDTEASDLDKYGTVMNDPMLLKARIQSRQ